MPMPRSCDVPLGSLVRLVFSSVDELTTSVRFVPYICFTRYCVFSLSSMCSTCSMTSFTSVSVLRTNMMRSFGLVIIMIAKATDTQVVLYEPRCAMSVWSGPWHIMLRIQPLCSSVRRVKPIWWPYSIGLS